MTGEVELSLAELADFADLVRTAVDRRPDGYAEASTLDIVRAAGSFGLLSDPRWFTPAVPA